MKNLARTRDLALERQQRNDAEVERILSDPASDLLPAHEFARSVAQAKVAGYGVGVDAVVAAALDAFERRMERGAGGPTVARIIDKHGGMGDDGDLRRFRFLDETDAVACARELHGFLARGAVAREGTVLIVTAGTLAR